MWDLIVIFYSCFILIKFHPKTLGFVNPKLGFKSMCRQKFWCSWEEHTSYYLSISSSPQCNTEKFCSALTHSQHGHICSCPKGSKCTHFFLWSLWSLFLLSSQNTLYSFMTESCDTNKLRQTIPYSHLFLRSVSKTGNVTHLSWKYPSHFS